MSVLDRLWSGPAGKWVQAQEQATLEEINFDGLLILGDDNWGKPIEGAPILPGREYDSITYDLCDWEGISLEFRGYSGDPPNEAERKRIFALGFTVIRIDYADKDLWTTQHKFHGDWSCVEGQEPHEGKPIRVGVDQCPTHFMDATGSGPCVKLFGHEERCEHAPREELANP